MKKSTLAIITCLISAAAAVCLLLYYLKFRQTPGDASSDKNLSMIGEEDYMDDLDMPELTEDPDKDDRSFVKVRRGYIPIRLGRA